MERFQDDASLAVLPKTQSLVANLVENARRGVLESLFGPIRTALQGYSRDAVWARVVESDPDMPKLRPDPTPAVARVVEHLFALLHHLESLSMEDQDYWLNLVVKHTVEMFVKQIESVPKMSAQGKEQLQIDLSAVSNVLSALGVPAPATLTNVAKVSE